MRTIPRLAGLLMSACRKDIGKPDGGTATGGHKVETFWDWITVFAFAGLATLLLQRSAEEEPRDQLWQYAPPAVGCAVVNYIGNEGYHFPAAVLFGAVIVYIFKVLKVPVPFLK
jgi:hypothetical protein